jgi:D-threo-aldose 1-dehydrogenase
MPYDPLERRAVGCTGLTVTAMGLGGAHLARPGVEPATSDALIRRALGHGLRYVDTAPMYSIGESERRYRAPLATLARDEYVLSTKVGRLLDGTEGAETGWHFDFSADAVHRSIESSLKRLGVDRIDIVFIHDPDDHWEQAIGEAYRALHALREQGIVRAIGAGMNQWEMEQRFAEEGEFDCFLLAGRYTLLEQESLASFLPLCEERGISVVVGGPYNSGILASDLDARATYNYRAAPPDVLERARRIAAVSERHGVPLKAAAIQFPLAHPAVAAVIPGAMTVAEVDENVALVQHPIPAALWAELAAEGLLAAGAPAPA